MEMEVPIFRNRFRNRTVLHIATVTGNRRFYRHEKQSLWTELWSTSKLHASYKLLISFRPPNLTRNAINGTFSNGHFLSSIFSLQIEMQYI